MEGKCSVGCAGAVTEVSRRRGS